MSFSAARGPVRASAGSKRASNSFTRLRAMTGFAHSVRSM